jgi:hypothetical protein
MVTNQFRVSKVYFTMPGLWEVRLTLISSDGQKETKTFSVNI